MSYYDTTGRHHNSGYYTRQSYGRGRGRGRGNSSRSLSLVTVQVQGNQNDDGEVIRSLLPSNHPPPSKLKSKSKSLVLINKSSNNYDNINDNNNNKEKTSTSSCLYYASASSARISSRKSNRGALQVGRSSCSFAVVDGNVNNCRSRKWNRTTDLLEQGNKSDNIDIDNDVGINSMTNSIIPEENVALIMQQTNQHQIQIMNNVSYNNNPKNNNNDNEVNHYSNNDDDSRSAAVSNEGIGIDGDKMNIMQDESDDSDSDSEAIASSCTILSGSSSGNLNRISSRKIEQSVPILKGPCHHTFNSKMTKKGLKPQNKKWVLPKDDKIKLDGNSDLGRNTEHKTSTLDLSVSITESDRALSVKPEGPILKGPISSDTHQSNNKRKRGPNAKESFVKAVRVTLNGDNTTGKPVLTDFAYRQTSKQSKATRTRGKSISRGLVKVDPKENDLICQKFLRGECYNERCTKRHDIPREAGIPICSFFQRGGMCTRENCPFLHIKVASKAELCLSFSEKGYCNNPNCSMKHFKQKPKKYGKN